MAKDTNWHRIEGEYRANKLSIRDIAAEFGISDTAIRKKAKELGWKRDLAPIVSKRTQEKLVRRAVKDKNASDAEVVDEISDRNATIIESHRSDIKIARGCASTLMDELLDSTKQFTTLEELVNDQAAIEDWDAERKAAVLRAISLPTRTKNLVDLANAMRVLQTLDRTAYGLDSEGEADSNESLAAALVEGIKRTRSKYE